MLYVFGIAIIVVVNIGNSSSNSDCGKIWLKVFRFIGKTRSNVRAGKKSSF
jgi:hypothetical protein